MTDDGSIRGIIFDMDGVLCDSEAFIREAAQRMFRERYGADIPDAAFTPYIGTGEDRFLGGPAADHGVSIRLPEDKDETYRLYLECIRGRLKPLDGVLTCVDQARAAGLRLAVASAADQVKVDGNLREIGLEPARFDIVISGDDVQAKKPDPAAFLLAAEGLGLNPTTCLVVEDAVNGVAAGIAAQAVVLGLTTSFPAPALSAAGAHYIAPHLGHIPAALRRRLGLPKQVT